MKFGKMLVFIYMLLNMVVFPIAIGLYILSFNVSDATFFQIEIFEVSYRIFLDLAISLGGLIFMIVIHFVLKAQIPVPDPNASEGEEETDTSSLSKV